MVNGEIYMKLKRRTFEWMDPLLCMILNDKNENNGRQMNQIERKRGMEKRECEFKMMFKAEEKIMNK